MVLDRITHMLQMASDGRAPFPPTVLFNENWLLRIVLDWFLEQPGAGDPVVPSPLVPGSSPGPAPTYTSTCRPCSRASSRRSCSCSTCESSPPATTGMGSRFTSRRASTSGNRLRLHALAVPSSSTTSRW